MDWICPMMPLIIYGYALLNETYFRQGFNATLLKKIF